MKRKAIIIILSVILISTLTIFLVNNKNISNTKKIVINNTKTITDKNEIKKVITLIKKSSKMDENEKIDYIFMKPIYTLEMYNKKNKIIKTINVFVFPNKNEGYITFEDKEDRYSLNIKSLIKIIDN